MHSVTSSCYQLSTVFLLQPPSSPKQHFTDQASLVGAERTLSVPVMLVMPVNSITLTALPLVIFVENCDVIDEGTFITRK
jgi:hypothetical protein